MGKRNREFVSRWQPALPRIGAVLLTVAALLGANAGLARRAARADALKPSEAPEPLRPWVDWVLRGHEQESCPFLHGVGDSRACLWPSRLELELDDRAGRFTQHWLVYRESPVSLPGEAKHWPQQVQVDGRPVPALERKGRPVVQLDEGEHTVSGVFGWDALPELLQIPAQTGLVRLRLRGQAVSFPRRDEQGRLWLQKRVEAEGVEESRIDIEVHRRATDEIPFLLESRIELKVSGRNREVVLGRALPDRFVPMALTGPVPARLDPDGRLRAQVRPGTWRLTLLARHEGPVETLVAADPQGPWDPSEVWVFDARPRLRVVTVEGGVPVDPARTALPEEWKHLPAFLMEPGRSLQLLEKQRGDSEPAPDALRLSRTWWLDFDGGGYTVTDRIEGTVRRSSRLEMGAETRLGRVALNGQDQFITRLEGSAAVGIEVPQGGIRLAADSRVEGRTAQIPAVGWDQNFQALQGELNLPHGWRLLHASGVDQAQSTWVNRWTLFDLFMVLVVGMVFFRLWGPGWGAFALLTLTLTFTERGAPQWVWVAVLVGEALRRVVPHGRFARGVTVYRGLALAALVLIAIPFLVDQVRAGLYPALEPPGEPDVLLLDEVRKSEVSLLEPLDLELSEEQIPAAGAVRESGMIAAPSKSRLQRYLYKPDPTARITTGPGLPRWRWKSVSLRWSGPVERTQQIRLVLLPPLVNGLLAFARVALLAALVLCTLGVSRANTDRWLRGGAMAAGLAAWMALLGAAGPVQADIPSPELLEELRARLLEKPECHPSCASSPRLRLSVQPRLLRARIEVDAIAETAVPLPGSAQDWVPETVLLDGAGAAGLQRGREGLLWLQVPPGRHQVVMEGPLPERDTIEIPLPLRPRRVEASTEGWQIHGLHEDGLAEETLQLTRIREKTSASDKKLAPGEFLPFVRVERSLHLGLSWEVMTQVQRVTPADTAVVLEIPLLEGESITTPGIRAEENRALVSMGPGVTLVHWSSLLEERGEVALLAPDAVPWTEVWRVDTSPIWHVDAEGIPVVHHPSPAGARIRQWQPWPGEEVRLRVGRPEGVEGPTLTVDSSALEVSPGLRATDSTLQLSLRSSRGGQHAITLPEDAELQSVKINGEVQPIRQEGRQVRLPLSPGTRQVEVVWREPSGIQRFFRTPEVDLGSASVNSEVRIALSPGRWALFTGGPRVGPAVLFWPLLVVFALIALGLGQISLTPLRFRHWLLLGLGLTQVPIPAAALVVVWLLVLGWRLQRGAQVPGRWFDLVQVCVAGLTVLALGVLFFSIQRGLLGLPEMQIGGNGSTSQLLRWYQDRTTNVLAQPWVLSAPLLVYRLSMLVWALWLAQAMVRWLRWGWSCFSAGELWRPLRGGTSAEGA